MREQRVESSAQEGREVGHPLVTTARDPGAPLGGRERDRRERDLSSGDGDLRSGDGLFKEGEQYARLLRHRLLEQQPQLGGYAEVGVAAEELDPRRRPEEGLSHLWKSNGAKVRKKRATAAPCFLYQVMSAVQFDG